MSYTMNDYLYMASKRRGALQKICARLGKEHPITKMLGSLAWARSEFETGPEPNLRSAVREVGAYDGMFEMISRWARDNDYNAQQILLELYSTRYESAK